MHTQLRLPRSHSIRNTVVAAGLLGCSSLLGQADEKLTQVHRELAAVQARLEALESETPPPPAMTDQDSVNVYVDRRGLVAETEDKAFRIRVRPRIQIVGNLFSDDDDGSTGFTLRRVRPVFEGNAGRVSWRFTPEFAGNVRILDAWAQVPFHGNVGLQAGKFKGPVGYERLQSFTNTLFIERGLPSVLTPAREIGAQLHGSAGDGLFEWTLGIFNGVLDDTDQSNNANFAGGDLDYGGRVALKPFTKQGNALAGLTFGIAATAGKESVTINDADRDQRIRYRTAGRGTFFRYANGVQLDGDRARLNPFLSWYYGPFGFLTEYISSSYDVSLGANSQKVDTDGCTIQASWVLTGENASYGAVRPKRPFNPSAGDWGSIELGVRYSVLRVDGSAFGDDPATRLAHASAVQQAESYGIGVNWNPTDNVRVAVNYEQTDFSGLGAKRNTEEAIVTSVSVHF